MKAIVKETGKIFDVYGVVNKTCDGYGIGEVDLIVDDKDSFNYDMTPAYWEKLKHKYAGMAMQGILASGDWDDYNWDIIAEDAKRAATALVQKLKEKEERK